MENVATVNTFTDVVTINHPGLDELSAKVLLERFLGTTLGIHSFANSLSMSDDEISTLDESGVFVIDLGRNQYKKKSYRSATEVVAKEFTIELTEAEKELVELIGQDNKTGILNKYVDAMSIPWTLRKMYELETYGNNPQDVVKRVSHVIHTWLKYKDRERDPSRDTPGMFLEFADLVERFDQAKLRGDHQFNHFTALRYMRDMWMIGIPIEEIRERTTYWIEAWQSVKDAIAEGNRQFTLLKPETFSVGGLKGLVLESGNSFLNRAAACNCDILVAKDPVTGHAIIATHNLNINNLMTFLSRQEPGKWFGIRGWAVNGGLRNRAIEPTRLTMSELVDLVSKFPPHK